MTSLISKKRGRNYSNFCELERDPLTQIFTNLLETHPASYNNIRIFNDTMKYKIPEIINSTSLLIKGRKITFSNTRIVKDNPSLPAEFRRKEKNYLLNIFSTVDIDGEKEEISLGSIPLMLGSEECPLSKMNKFEKMRNGEDPNDPFGYFLLGTEKFVVDQEKLRVSNSFAFKSKNGPISFQKTIEFMLKKNCIIPFLR